MVFFPGERVAEATPFFSMANPKILLLEKVEALVKPLLDAKGMDVVDALGALPVVNNAEGETSKPVTPPVFRKVTILP